MVNPMIRERTGLGDLGLSVLVGILLLIEFVMAPAESLHRLSAEQVNLVSGLGLGAGALLLNRTLVYQGVVLLVTIFSAVFNLLNGPHVSTYHVAESALHFVILGILIGGVSGAVFAPGKVNLHRILGSIAIYLLVVLVFANAFSLVRDLVPDAFSYRTTWNGLYFSFTTVTTSGYGDVVALSPVARSLSNMESVFGQLYPATIIARLVTLHIQT